MNTHERVHAVALNQLREQIDELSASADCESVLLARLDDDFDGSEVEVAVERAVEAATTLLTQQHAAALLTQRIATTELFELRVGRVADRMLSVASGEIERRDCTIRELQRERSDGNSVAELRALSSAAVAKLHDEIAALRSSHAASRAVALEAQAELRSELSMMEEICVGIACGAASAEQSLEAEVRIAAAQKAAAEAQMNSAEAAAAALYARTRQTSVAAAASANYKYTLGRALLHVSEKTAVRQPPPPPPPRVLDVDYARALRDCEAAHHRSTMRRWVTARARRQCSARLVRGFNALRRAAIFGEARALLVNRRTAMRSRELRSREERNLVGRLQVSHAVLLQEKKLSFAALHLLARGKRVAETRRCFGVWQSRTARAVRTGALGELQLHVSATRRHRRLRHCWRRLLDAVSASKRERRTHNVLLSVGQRWRDLLRRRAFETLVAATHRAAHRRSALRSIFLRRTRREAVQCLRRWSCAAQEAQRSSAWHRRAAQRIASERARKQRHAKRNTLRRWSRYCEQIVHMKRVGQRVLGLWRQRAAGAYLRTWRTAVRAKLRLRKASNAVQRLASGRLRTTGWREWVVHVEDRLHRTRLRTRASVFARKREREKLRLCLDAWDTVLASSQRITASLRRVLAYHRKRTLREGMRGWRRAVCERVQAEQREQRIAAGAMQLTQRAHRRAKLSVVEAWRAETMRSAHYRRVVSRVAVRWQLRSASAMLLGWSAAVKRRARARTVVAKSLRRLMHASLTSGWSGWVSAVQRRVSQRRLCAYGRELAYDRGLRSLGVLWGAWNELRVRQRRRRALLSLIATRHYKRTLQRAVHHWWRAARAVKFDHRETSKLRIVARKVMRRTTCTRLNRSLRTWQEWVNTARRLRRVRTTVERKRRRRALGEYVRSWSSAAAARAGERVVASSVLQLRCWSAWAARAGATKLRRRQRVVRVQRARARRAHQLRSCVHAWAAAAWASRDQRGGARALASIVSRAALQRTIWQWQRVCESHTVHATALRRRLHDRLAHSFRAWIACAERLQTHRRRRARRVYVVRLLAMRSWVKLVVGVLMKQWKYSGYYVVGAKGGAGAAALLVGRAVPPRAAKVTPPRSREVVVRTSRPVPPPPTESMRILVERALKPHPEWTNFRTVVERDYSTHREHSLLAAGDRLERVRAAHVALLARSETRSYTVRCRGEIESVREEGEAGKQKSREVIKQCSSSSSSSGGNVAAAAGGGGE